MTDEPAPASSEDGGDLKTGSFDEDERSPLAEPIPDRIGHYIVEDRIGRGGMGVVYRGRDARLGREVAIKALPGSVQAGSRRRARFDREAKLLALVDHPGIAAIYALAEADGRPFLILELVRGETLQAVIERGPMPLAVALDVGIQIAAAVAAAHELGVIHRDLKPANVMVAARNRIKVLDFGLAKVMSEIEQSDSSERSLPLDPLLSADGAVVGTVAYMSPEQVRGEAVDQRADVWGLGCVLFECLTGHRWKTEAASRGGLDELPAATPAAVRELLQRCLEPDLPRRLGHIGEAREELEAARAALITPDRSRARGAMPGNLPRPGTAFVGRDREQEELARLLAEPGLITLTGTGGCGKTRLAIEVARRQAAAFPDGIFIVDLSALDEAARVPGAVARALGITEESGERLAHALTGAVEGRSLLVILDNCEHLRTAAAEAAELLLEAGLSALVATSREPLEVAGERVLALAPLPVPDPAVSTDLATLGGNEAVRLFLDRAAVAAPGFTLGDDNRLAVARICHALDGIPLALELAAARLKALSVDQVAARLGDRFRLLVGKSRNAPPRHHTLRALIDWSYDLLGEPEKAVFRRLSVFSGSFSLEAVEAVCVGGGIEEPMVLDLLTQLLDRSLVVVERRSREARYRLLESVREYARERLAESGEQAENVNRHLAFYQALAAQARSPLLGPDQGRWLDCLDEELDNIRVALRHASWASSTEAELGLRLAAALEPFWKARGHAAEAREHLAALFRAAGESRRHAHLDSLNAAGALAYDQDDLAAAARLHGEALELARKSGAATAAARAARGLGLVDFRRGDLAAARSWFEEELSLARERGDRRAIAATLQNLGNVAMRQGRVDEARDHRLQALTLFRALGDPASIAMTLSALAVLEIGVGQLEEARAHIEQCLAIRRELGDQRGVARTRSNLATIAYLAGDLATARAIYEEVLPELREAGDRGAAAANLVSLGSVLLGLGDPLAARRRLREGLTLAVAIGDLVVCLAALESHAGADASAGAEQRAALLLGTADELRRTLGVAREDKDRDEHARSVASVRERLGEDELRRLLDDGSRLTLEQASALVLDEPA